MTARRVLVIAALLVSCGDASPRSEPMFDADLLRDAGLPSSRDASTSDVVVPRDAMRAVDGAIGPDVGVDASTRHTCDTPRVCTAPSSGVGTTFDAPLDTGVDDGNIRLHAGVWTSRGPVLPWSARQCCGADPKPLSAGVVRFGDDASSFRLFGPIVDPPTDASPSIATVGSSLWVTDPLRRFTRAVVLDRDTLTAIDERDVALGIDVLETPALAPLDDGGTLALVPTSTTTELRRLGPDGALVSSIDLGHTSTRLALTPTCRGFLATWEQGADAVAMPIAPDGTPSGEARVYGETTLETQIGHRAVAFDGRHVVTVGPRQVYELSADGAVAAATLSLIAPVAAIGTDEGVVVMQLEATEGEGAPVVLLERETGAFVRELARIDTGTLYASDGIGFVVPSAGTTPTSMYFAAASYGRRGQLGGARIDCR